MRTLKRTLSLVLALAMVLSLCAINVSASDFSDIDKSQHKEAVDVLNAIGVISGYNYTDEVRPDETLTRGQAAKIATLLMGVDVENQNLPINFSDVGYYHWAKNYISYCAGEGILSGYGNGNFGPDDPITGVAFAKIMLGVLGYNAAEEGLSFSESWAVTTSSLAARVGLAADLDSNFSWSDSVAVNRDNAFQLAYNALTANIVKYPTRTTVVAGETTVVITGDADTVNGNGVRGAGNDYRDGYTGTDSITQLCEKNFPDLNLKLEDEDVFHRLGNGWYNGVDTNPSNLIIFTPDTPVDTYNGDFTKKVADALRKSNNNDIPDIYYNGNKVADPATTTWRHAIGQSGLWANNTTGCPGYELEVYQEASGSYRVVYREAYLGKVGATDKDTGDITLTVYGAGGNISGVNFTIDKDDDVYTALSKFAKDDYIAVYPDSGWNPGTSPSGAGSTNGVGILEVAALDVVEDVTITRTDAGSIKAFSSLVANGTTYRFNDQALRLADKVITTSGVVAAINTGSATLYLHNGYILLVDQTAADTNKGYAYLYDVKETTSSGWVIGEQTEKEYWAKLYLADGTDTEVQLNTDLTEVRGKTTETASIFVEFDSDQGDSGNSGLAPNNGAKKGILVHYTIESNGKYTLKAMTNDSSNGGTLNIKSGQANGVVPNNKKVVFDSKTVFFVVTTDSDTQAKTVNVYTGIANVPTLTGDDASTVTAAAEVNSGAVRDAVDESGNRVTAVLVKNPNGNTTSNNYFIAGNAGAEIVTERVGNNDVVYYEYNAVVGGQITKVKVGAGSTEPAYGGYSRATLISSITTKEYDFADGTDNVITKFGSTVGTPIDGTMTVTVEQNTVVNINTASAKRGYVATETAIFGYNLNDGSIKKLEVGDIEEYLTAINANGASKGFYVIKSGTIETMTELYLNITPQ